VIVEDHEPIAELVKDASNDELPPRDRAIGFPE